MDGPEPKPNEMPRKLLNLTEDLKVEIDTLENEKKLLEAKAQEQAKIAEGEQKKLTE